MSTLQAAMDDLEREVKAIIETAGYDPRTLVLKVNVQPGQGWHFEALAATGKLMRRQLGSHFGSADDFVRHLRRVMEVEQLKLQLT